MARKARTLRTLKVTHRAAKRHMRKVAPEAKLALRRLATVSAILAPACAPGLIGSVTGSGAGIAGLTISPSLGFVSGGIYGDADVSSRTISFTHNGTTVSCSHNGTTFSSCDSASTMILTAADFSSNATIKIKVSKAGYADSIYTLRLGTDTTASVVACDTVISASSDFVAVTTALAGNSVVCIDSGVTISNSNVIDDARIVIPANKKIIGIGSGGSRPLFTTSYSNATAANRGIFQVGTSASTVTGAAIANVRMSKSAATAFGAVYVDSQTDPYPTPTVTITNVDCTDSTGSVTNAGCLYATNSAYVTMTDSTLSTTGTATRTVLVEFPTTRFTGSGLTVTQTHATGYEAFKAGGIVSLTGSSFTSAGGGTSTFSVTDFGALTLSSSSITHSNAASDGFYANGSGYATVTDTTISAPNTNSSGIRIDDPTSVTHTFNNVTVTSGAASLWVTLNNAVAVPHVVLENVVFKHANGTGIDDTAVYLDGSQTSLRLDSTGNNNRFCNIGTATPWFTGNLTGTTNAGSTLLFANQINGGAIHTCP